jgi:hypothetical protein
MSIDGNILSGGSIDVSSGSKEVKYAIGISAFTGTKTLTVNVIDDVLYDTSASIDINFQAPSPTTINTNNQNGAVRTAYISHYSNNSGNR